MSDRPSMDTSEVRCAVLSVTNWVVCSPELASLWLDRSPSTIGPAMVGSIGPLMFCRVTGEYAVWRGLYVIQGDYVEQISEPCLLCEETGRVQEERHGGQSERWVACSCLSGHGEPGEWS